MTKPTFFTLNQDGSYSPVTNPPNGKAKSLMSHVIGYSVIACYAILGMAAYHALSIGDSAISRVIWDNIHVVIVMTVGAFLALAKDIFHPRREITMDDIMNLVNGLVDAKAGANSNPNSRPTSTLTGGRI